MLKFVFFLLASFVTSNLALADGHETAIADPAEISFVFNTLLFCIGGFLVMWMAAGFTMLEAGLVRSKNTVVYNAIDFDIHSSLPSDRPSIPIGKLAFKAKDLLCLASFSSSLDLPFPKYVKPLSFKF